MKLRRPSHDRRPPKEGQTARKIVNGILILSAVSVVALGGIGGYALYGISGMLVGVFLGIVIAFLVYL